MIRRPPRSTLFPYTTLARPRRPVRVGHRAAASGCRGPGLQLARRSARSPVGGRLAVRVQGLRRGPGGAPLRRAPDGRLRLRRRAPPDGTGRRVSYRRGPGELGRPAGEQGRGAAARPGDALADRQGATSHREATLSFARRVREVEPFLAVEMGERAQALERSGGDALHFEVGEPDFEAPAVIREAVEKAVKGRPTRYTPSPR